MRLTGKAKMNYSWSKEGKREAGNEANIIREEDRVGWR